MGPETVHLWREAFSINGFGQRTIPWVTSWLREYCQVQKTTRRRRICCSLKHSFVILAFPSTFTLPIFRVSLIEGKWLSGSTIGRKNQLGYTVKVFTIYIPNSAATHHSRGGWYQGSPLSSTNIKTQTCFGPLHKMEWHGTSIHPPEHLNHF